MSSSFKKNSREVRIAEYVWKLLTDPTFSGEKFKNHFEQLRNDAKKRIEKIALEESRKAYKEVMQYLPKDPFTKFQSDTSRDFGSESRKKIIACLKKNPAGKRDIGKRTGLHGGYLTRQLQFMKKKGMIRPGHGGKRYLKWELV